MGEKVLIAGGSGLVGKRLSQLLHADGYSVSILSRVAMQQTDVESIYWNPAKGEISKTAFDTDHLINLAGAGIADKPWTKSRKKALVDSRIVSANFLFDQFKQEGVQLKSYQGASAIGYYGDGGDTLQKESDLPAYQSFMTGLCADWEEAHLKFDAIADQVSILRIGIVLSTKGGAYQKMRLPFKFGLGTYFGSGSQYYSWIHIDDLARMFIYLLQEGHKTSIYNAVSPEPVTNKQLIKSIKNALALKAIIQAAPAAIIKMTMGQLSKVILNSNRVSSKKIEDAGFNFNFPEIEKTIQDIEAKSI